MRCCLQSLSAQYLVPSVGRSLHQLLHSPNLKKKKLFIWTCWVLVAACRIFSCSMWDLVLCPGINPGPPALGAQSLSHWTTRKVYPASLLKPVFPTCKLEVKFFFSTFISPTPPAPNTSTLSL